MSTIRLTKLKTEGRLTPGDQVQHDGLGTCEIVTIHDKHTIDVRRVLSDTYHRLSGLYFGADARVVQPAGVPA